MAQRQPYSKEQWDAQKPTIQYLYNTQNLPFQNVVEILERDYQFYPTRKQFYRKIDQWGLKKNIKKGEMEVIAQNINQGEKELTSSIPAMRGCRVTQARIDRWIKKHGRMKSMVCSIRGGHGTSVPVSRLAPDIIEDDVFGRDGERFRISGRHDLENPRYPEWVSVDVPGSPTLSRLFQALKIECSKEIPPLTLDGSVSKAAEEYLEASLMSDFPETRKNIGKSNSERDELNPGDFTDPLSDTEQEISMISTKSVPLYSSQSFSERAIQQCDFSKSCLYKIKISPFNELSPFPFWPADDEVIPTPDELWIFGQSQQLHKTESECLVKLNMLKNAPDLDNCTITFVKSELANIRWEMGNLASAEELWREVSFLCQNIFGPTSYNTLYAELQVIEVILSQGRYAETEEIHPRIHATILNFADVYDELVIKSYKVKAYIHLTRHEIEEVDKIYRWVLQIRLNTLGPRSNHTLYALRRLGSLMTLRWQALESEQLLRTVACLHREVKSRPKIELFFDLLELSRALNGQGRYSECCALARNVADQSEAFLGPEHPGTLSSYFEIAYSLIKKGQLEECIAILKKILAQQSTTCGSRHPDTNRTIALLASALAMAGCFEEAIFHYKGLFRTAIEHVGGNSPYTAATCLSYGKCYEDQSRYEDAVTLYLETLRPIVSLGSDLHPSFLKICERLRYLHAFMPAGSRVEYCSAEGETIVLAGPDVHDVRVTEEEWINSLVNFEMSIQGI